MRKNILLLTLVLLVATNAFATSFPDSDGTKLSLWIPGFFVKMAAGIAEKHSDGFDAELLKSVGSVSLCIREGAAYKGSYDKKVTRKLRRMEKRDFEELLLVKDEGTNVQIQIRENKRGDIKRLVVLVDDHAETFVYIKMHCKISAEELGQWVSENMQRNLR